MYNGNTGEILFPPAVIPARVGYSVALPEYQGIGKEQRVVSVTYSEIIAWVIAPVADRDDGTLMEPNWTPVTITPLPALFAIHYAPEGSYTFMDGEKVHSVEDAIDEMNDTLTSNIIDFEAAKRGLKNKGPGDAA